MSFGAFIRYTIRRMLLNENLGMCIELHKFYSNKSNTRAINTYQLT